MPDQPTPPADPRPLLGIELGGTKCIATLAHGPGALLAQQAVATTTPDETLGALGAIAQRWWDAHGFAALGIASFGPVDLDPASASFGCMLATPKPHWARADVARRLARPFAVPMAFDTDVNGAALAEIAWGAGRGLADFAYVTVGTGVGVGLIVHGRPTRGIGHSEIGHLRVPRLPGDTAPSSCPFHDDCVEGLASGPALRLALGDRPVEALTPEDPVWDRVVHALACMAHALLCTTGPLRIALGGGVITRQPHLLAAVETRTRASLNGYLRLPGSPLIVAPELGDQAGPLGAIALAATARQSAGRSPP